MNFNSRYEFNPKIDLLGKGGFSKVYKANDTLLDRTVALKFFTGSGAEKYQILNEIKRVIKFEHPNLCKYYDVAVLDSKNVFGETELIEVGIMEYLDAGDFKTYIKNNPQYLDKLLIDVLKGLSYLHRKGLVHRDLKPQNIIIKIEDDEPVAKITDFGISKLISSDDTNSSALIGTIEYMAPEQFNPKKYGIGGKITTNLDLWSFGLLVYEALAHASLFGSRKNGASAEQLMQNIMSDAYLAKSKLLPEKYQAIIDRCLVKHAADRVQNALELIPLFEGKTGWPEATGHGPVIAIDTSVDLSETADDDPTTIFQPQADHDDQTQVIPHSDDLSSKKDSGPVTEKEKLGEIMPAQLLPQHGETAEDATQILRPSDLSTDETRFIQLKDEDADDATQVLNIGDWNRNHEDETMVLQRPRDGSEKPSGKLPVTTSSKLDKTGRGQDKLEATNQARVKDDNSRPIDQNKRKKMLLFAAIPIVLLIIFFAFRYINRSAPVISDPKHIESTDSNHAVIPAFVPPELVYVKGGDFIMGNGTTEATAAELPEHEVTMTAFSIGKYEVTIDQFRQFINETKYVTTAETEGQSGVFLKGKWETGKGVNWRFDIAGKLTDAALKNIPVIHVSWNDASKYCEWLSGKMKKHIRLPTEAEWEYAARGGIRSLNLTYSGSDKIEEVAWSGKNSGNQLRQVGTKVANELGIYDMSGNVMEWCNDWYDENYYKASTANDPHGPATGTARVVRGGSWFLAEKRWFYNTARGAFAPTVSGSQVGFRICEVNN